MTLSFYIDYFNRCCRELSMLDRSNGCLAYYWYDFIKCSLIHGSILHHYTRGGFHKIKGVERRKSMTYRRILRTYKKCNSPQAQPLLEDKARFNTHFQEVVRRAWLLSWTCSFEEFNELCDKCTDKGLIIKPYMGVNGENIRKCAVPAETGQRKELYSSLRKERYIIEECLEQHPDMKIGGKAVNTIRAFSILDRNGNVQILKLLLRVGVGDSVVDNYSAGGCVYEVDAKTGIVISPSLTKKGETVFIHPGTDTCMLGYRLPNWQKVLASIEKAQKLIPQNRFTGWDIAITPDGVEFIEGNHNPGYELLEFFGTTGWYERIKPFV